MEPLPIQPGARSDIGAAAKAAVEAAHNTEQLALIQAVLKAQQLTQQPAPTPPPVQQSPASAGKWIGIGVGASVFLLTVALSAVAVAISVVSLTVCVLVLRSVWHDIRKGH
ncbi:hypothetical protein OG217_23245 [Streptomyces sp. NBC_01023]|uniref:hypothetical protein n=1 Tax=unclassified Streptomyces TaxID=2593676 RepID=UPI003246C4BC|nr:hypothetical protein OG217_23245 [Streptomyces sp. NBC_01023]